MAIRKYIGDRVVCLAADTKPTNMADGAILQESDTGAQFRLVAGTWVRTDLFTNLGDTPVSITGNNYVRGNAGGTALEFRTAAQVLTDIGAVPLTRTITLSEGTGMTMTGGTQDLSANRTWSIAHEDTSSVANSTNSNGVVIQSATFDGMGHVLTVATTDLDTRYSREAFKTIQRSADSGFTWGTSNVVAATLADLLKIVPGSGIEVDTDSAGKAIRIRATGSGGLTSAYVSMTDGTITANADGGDTFKFRSSDGSIAVTVSNNDATHGDNVNLIVDSVAWSKVTSTTNTLSGYGITDAVRNTREVIAGAGLSGGGALSSNVTLTLNAGLNNLTDTTITTPATGNLLQYNGSAWVNWVPNFLTANQTITLTGDITGSGTTSIATTIAANAVTSAKFRQSAGFSVVGKSTTGTGNVADIVAGVDSVLRRSASGDLTFGTLVTNNIGNSQVTYAKIVNGAALSVLGRSANSAGVLADIAAGADAHVLRRDGTTIGFGTIGDASITGLAWSKITGTPTTLAGYGITDGGASMAIGGTITNSPNTHSLLFVGTGGLLAQDTLLVWETSTDYMGVGRGSGMSERIDVLGNVRIEGQLYFPIIDSTGEESTITINWKESANHKIDFGVVAGTGTVVFSNPKAGATYTIMIYGAGVASHTINWPSAVKWVGGDILSSIAGGAGSAYIVQIFYDGTSYISTYGEVNVA
jgi:hypothetical protein